MGLKVDKIRKNPPQFLSLTGFSPNEFDELLEEFRNEWEQYSNHFTLEGKPRQRIALPRKTNVLPGVHDKLLFILMYLKTYPLQELQAATFSMTQPQANFWIHLLSPILGKTLYRLKELPERNNQKIEQLLKDCPDVLLDGVERSIQRPLDYELQQECYSGKKNA
jgi:Helix-turn-helix of DDE superfamily endonuclease